jgi:hypothetical protein
MFIRKADDRRPPMWIQSTVTYATTNRIGEILLTSASQKPEDATDLVESFKKRSSDEIIWTTLCKLIDYALFFGFFIAYFFMFITLLPEGYLSFSYDPIDSIS